MAAPMTRRSRRRGCSVEKKTEDNQGVSHTEDVLVECMQCPEEESERKKSIEPLMSTILEEKTKDKNEETDLPEVTISEQLVVQAIVPNENETINNDQKHAEGYAVKNTDVLEQQMTAEDNLHHKIETNQDLDEVKSILIEQVVEGSAKKKRRMGMCHLSEKERNRIIPKVNRTVRSGKQNDIRIVAEEENGSSSYPETTDIMPPLTTEPLKSSPNHEDQKDESVVESGLNCEDAPKEGLGTGVIAKHQKETETQRMEMECEMKVVALPVSILNICKYETNVTDLSLENNHCTEEEQTRGIISSQEIVIQTSHQEAENDHQPKKTDTGAHLTVTACNETEAARAPPHLDNEHSSRSETGVHLTTKLSDVSNTTREQNPVRLDGSPEPKDASALPNTKEKEKVNELEPQNNVDATFTKTHKLPAVHVDVDHNPGDHCDTKSKEAEDPPTEQGDLHQQDMKDNTSLENLAQMLETPLLIHTSVSITASETTSISFYGSHSDENKLQDTAVCMGPTQWRDVSDSQLNTIDMTVQVEADGSEVSPGGYEDVTGLVGGLIRELSSLNRAVMATHRELENLRRRGKNSRNSIH